mmetsp:Transcript_122396/g.351713  ORF Transcript_122396/g.351713 Transcript_122396/m.351713 type:complete len:221 (+) Transcript_122396:86-748(+)
MRWRGGHAVGRIGVFSKRARPDRRAVALHWGRRLWDSGLSARGAPPWARESRASDNWRDSMEISVGRDGRGRLRRRPRGRADRVRAGAFLRHAEADDEELRPPCQSICGPWCADLQSVPVLWRRLPRAHGPGGKLHRRSKGRVAEQGGGQGPRRRVFGGVPVNLSLDTVRAHGLVPLVAHRSRLRLAGRVPINAPARRPGENSHAHQRLGARLVAQASDC